jgi:hypothetical protein
VSIVDIHEILESIDFVKENARDRRGLPGIEKNVPIRSLEVISQPILNEKVALVPMTPPKKQKHTSPPPRPPKKTRITSPPPEPVGDANLKRKRMSRGGLNKKNIKTQEQINPDEKQRSGGGVTADPTGKELFEEPIPELLVGSRSLRQKDPVLH